MEVWIFSRFKTTKIKVHFTAFWSRLQTNVYPASRIWLKIWVLSLIYKCAFSYFFKGNFQTNDSLKIRNQNVVNEFTNFWPISYSCYHRYNYRSYLSIYTSKKLANNHLKMKFGFVTTIFLLIKEHG